MGTREGNILQDSLENGARRNFPEKIEQLPTGTYLILREEEQALKQKEGAIYIRVSSHDQKEDLQRQLQRLRDYANENNLLITIGVSEIASGMNARRAKLKRLLKDSTIDFIIVEHKDRLTRFGFEYLQSALLSAKREIIVVNHSDCKDDLVHDMIDILTSFCARLYGQRSARNRRKKISRQ